MLGDERVSNHQRRSEIVEWLEMYRDLNSSFLNLEAKLEREDRRERPLV
jgi:hypothetical protein